MHPEKFVAESVVCHWNQFPLCSGLKLNYIYQPPLWSSDHVWVGGMWSAIIFRISPSKTLGERENRIGGKLGLEWASKSAINQKFSVGFEGMKFRGRSELQIGYLTNKCKSLGMLEFKWAILLVKHNLVYQKKKFPKEISIPNINVHGTHIEMRYFMWI